MSKYKNVDEIPSLFNEKYKRTMKLIKQGETHLDNLAEGFLEAQQVISKIPTADVVEVVRCKDCKSRDEELYCRQVSSVCLDRFVTDDWFCPCGERKETE